MKFRNILLTTFAASAFVIGTTSCSDSFLDEKMYSSYGPEVSDVNAKLVGLHRQYAAIWGMSSQQGFVGCWQVGTDVDRKSTRLNSSHITRSRMPSSA